MQRRRLATMLKAKSWPSQRSCKIGRYASRNDVGITDRESTLSTSERTLTSHDSRCQNDFENCLVMINKDGKKKPWSPLRRFDHEHCNSVKCTAIQEEEPLPQTRMPVVQVSFRQNNHAETMASRDPQGVERKRPPIMQRTDSMQLALAFTAAEESQEDVKIAVNGGDTPHYFWLSTTALLIYGVLYIAFAFRQLRCLRLIPIIVLFKMCGIVLKWRDHYKKDADIKGKKKKSLAQQWAAFVRQWQICEGENSFKRSLVVSTKLAGARFAQRKINKTLHDGLLRDMQSRSNRHLLLETNEKLQDYHGMKRH